MTITRNTLDPAKFNDNVQLPYELRLEDFRLAVQDVYDFFFDVNMSLAAKGLERLDDTLRPAIMSGVLSDMLTASLARHSRTLTVNGYFNGHPDLVRKGVHPNNAVKAGDQGVEVKTTRKRGGRVRLCSGQRDRARGAETADVLQRDLPRPGRHRRLSEKRPRRTRHAHGDVACAGHRQTAQPLALSSMRQLSHDASTRSAASRGMACAARSKYALSRSMPTLR